MKPHFPPPALPAGRKRPAPAGGKRPNPAAIALLIAWAAGGPAAAGEPRTGAGPGAEVAREIQRAPRLAANHSNAERYVVAGVCEAGGLEQIGEILEQAKVEEMWAFLPRAHGSGACEWHEIGRGETAGRGGAYVRVDMAYVERLMAANAEIHLVHFHPLRYFECASDAACSRETAGPAGTVDQRWITDLLFSMPSPSDVHFMMDATSRFHRNHQASGTIRHKVVTPYGIVDYGLTGAGLAKFEYEMHSRSEGRYITWVVASGLADDSIESVVKDNPGSIAAAVRGLAQKLNTQFLRVEHRLPQSARRRTQGERATP